MPRFVSQRGDSSVRSSSNSRYWSRRVRGFRSDPDLYPRRSTYKTRSPNVYLDIWSSGISGGYVDLSSDTSVRKLDSARSADSLGGAGRMCPTLSLPSTTSRNTFRPSSSRSMNDEADSRGGLPKGKSRGGRSCPRSINAASASTSSATLPPSFSSSLSLSLSLQSSSPPSLIETTDSRSARARRKRSSCRSRPSSSEFDQLGGSPSIFEPYPAVARLTGTRTRARTPVTTRILLSRGVRRSGAVDVRGFAALIPRPVFFFASSLDLGVWEPGNVKSGTFGRQWTTGSLSSITEGGEVREKRAAADFGAAHPAGCRQQNQQQRRRRFTARRWSPTGVLGCGSCSAVYVLA